MDDPGSSTPFDGYDDLADLWNQPNGQHNPPGEWGSTNTPTTPPALPEPPYYLLEPMAGTSKRRAGDDDSPSASPSAAKRTHITEAHPDPPAALSIAHRPRPDKPPPPAILTRIFLHLARACFPLTPGSFNPRATHLAATHVNSLWRTVALSPLCSAFWAYLPLALGARWTQTALERAAAAPVHVTLWARTTWRAAYRAAAGLVMGAHTHRIASLVLKDEYGYGEAADERLVRQIGGALEACSFLALTHLELAGLQLAVEMFGGRTPPALRSVSLSRCGVSASCTLFGAPRSAGDDSYMPSSQLSSLALKECNLPTEELLWILARMPHLRALEVEGLLKLADGNTNIDEEHGFLRAALPELDDLKVQGRAAAIIPLLRHLQLKQTVAADVELHDTWPHNTLPPHTFHGLAALVYDRVYPAASSGGVRYDRLAVDVSGAHGTVGMTLMHPSWTPHNRAGMPPRLRIALALRSAAECECGLDGGKGKGKAGAADADALHALPPAQWLRVMLPVADITSLELSGPLHDLRALRTRVGPIARITAHGDAAHALLRALNDSTSGAPAFPLLDALILEGVSFGARLDGVRGVVRATPVVVLERGKPRRLARHATLGGALLRAVLLRALLGLPRVRVWVLGSMVAPHELAALRNALGVEEVLWDGRAVFPPGAGPEPEPEPEPGMPLAPALGGWGEDTTLRPPRMDPWGHSAPW
ncbi:hypothetical protein BC834DRAFT_904387 [Gloeopeniophorella convolvens]|nr:hypothetical protein BC834DRAFT_904387 [Gloeopeniophorella convolvens]